MNLVIWEGTPTVYDATNSQAIKIQHFENVIKKTSIHINNYFTIHKLCLRRTFHNPEQLIYITSTVDSNGYNAVLFVVMCTQVAAAVQTYFDRNVTLYFKYAHIRKNNCWNQTIIFTY